MKFAEAFAAMKAGAKVKLPHWAGYWSWDPENQTVLMHCRPEESDNGKPVMDIRESQRVEYTLTNICSDEWMIADESNCPKLGGRRLMAFGAALRMANAYGCKIAREGWSGIGQHVEIGEDITYVNVKGETVRADNKLIGSKALVFVGVTGVQMGWLASQADMLADDWYIVE